MNKLETIKILSEIFVSILSVLLTWPVAIFSLGIIFMSKYSKEIKSFILKISSFKFAGAELLQQNNKDEDISRNVEAVQQDSVLIQALESANNDLTIKENQKKEILELANHFFERAELFEFRFLNLFLVQNSKNAILWFLNGSSKDNYNKNFVLISNEQNGFAKEKSKIFDIILIYGLVQISASSEIYYVSEKGDKFLKFIGIINQ